MAKGTIKRLITDQGFGFIQTAEGEDLPNESSGLRLLYATLLTASRTWKGIRMTPEIWLELAALRREAFGEQVKELEKELVAV